MKKMLSAISRRKSILVSWLLSYVMILLLPLVVSSFAYVESVRIIGNELNKGHMSSLEQIQQVIERRLTDIEKLIIEIGMNENINEVANYKDIFQPYHVFSMTNIIKDLKTIKLASGLIDDFYIYFKYNDMVLSYIGGYSSDHFYSFYIEEKGLEYDKWIQILQDKYYKKYLPIYSEDIFFVQSLPIVGVNKAVATLLVNINTDTLQQLLQKANWTSQGLILVIDGEDRIISSSQGLLASVPLSYDSLTEKQGVFNQNINGDNMVISYITSQVNDWKYIHILPQSVYLEKAKYLQRVILICIFLCLVLGGIAACIFIRRNYNPVKKLIDVLKEDSAAVDEREHNEYSFIEKSILQVIDDKNEMHSYMEKQKYVLRENFLMRLIKGEMKLGVPVADSCEMYDIRFSGEKFAIMLFYMENTGEGWLRENGDMEEVIDKVHFDLANVLKELFFKSRHTVFLTFIDKMPVCLVNFEDIDNMKAEEDLKQIAYQALQIIEDKLEIILSVAISNICNSLEELPSAYQETIEATEYRNIIGGERVIAYSSLQLQAENQGIGSSLLSEEQKFINCIKAENYTEAKAVLDVLFSNNFSYSQPSLQMVKCRMFGLINTMINVLQEVSITHREEFLEKHKPVELLLKCTGIADLQIAMNFILESLDEYVSSMKGNNATDLYGDVVEFIRLNYHNINLNVSMLADRFEVSASYLSRLFRKKINMSVLDYIHKVRIEKAKQLVKKQYISVKEIAEKVGFGDSRALIRVFKKHEGVTPGIYKELKSADRP